MADCWVNRNVIAPVHLTPPRTLDPLQERSSTIARAPSLAANLGCRQSGHELPLVLPIATFEEVRKDASPKPPVQTHLSQIIVPAASAACWDCLTNISKSIYSRNDETDPMDGIVPQCRTGISSRRARRGRFSAADGASRRGPPRLEADASLLGQACWRFGCTEAASFGCCL